VPVFRTVHKLDKVLWHCFECYSKHSVFGHELISVLSHSVGPKLLTCAWRLGVSESWWISDESKNLRISG
jgi:hypothetical protein